MSENYQRAAAQLPIDRMLNPYGPESHGTLLSAWRSAPILAAGYSQLVMASVVSVSCTRSPHHGNGCPLRSA